MSDSFRTMQAVSDLIHHVKPLLALHLATVAEASGLTISETGQAFRLLRDDGYCMGRDKTLPLSVGLKAIAIGQADGFDLAIVILLADLLQSGQSTRHLYEAWVIACKRLRNWPATLRAAVANGLRRAAELGAITLETPPTDADCQTRQPAEIAEPLLRIARSMRRDELYAMAQSDLGGNVEHHFAALMDLVGNRDGIFPGGNVRSLFKIIEFTADLPNAPGFEGCTAISLLNTLTHGDLSSEIDQRWLRQGAAYCALRPSARDPILAGIRHLYETHAHFQRNAHLDLAGRLTEGATIPVVGDLL